MNNLFFWGEGYRNIKNIKGVPFSVHTLIMDTRNGIPGNWTLYDSTYHPIPPSLEFRLPDYLYMKVPFKGEVLFDFIGWNGKLKIFSEDLFEYLKNYGLNSNYEISEIKEVYNSANVLLKTKKYYALRFYKFDDEEFDFNTSTKIRAVGMQGRSALYPNMSLKFTSVKQVFILKELVYNNGLIITKEIKDFIENKFIGPPIHPIQEFHHAYNGV